MSEQQIESKLKKSRSILSNQDSNSQIVFESKKSEEQQENFSDGENNLVVDLGNVELNKGASFEFNNIEDKQKETTNSLSEIETKIISLDSKIIVSSKGDDKKIDNNITNINPSPTSNNDFEVITDDSYKPSPIVHGTNNSEVGKELSPYMFIDKESDSIEVRIEKTEAKPESDILHTSPSPNENDLESIPSKKISVSIREQSENIQNNFTSITNNQNIDFNEGLEMSEAKNSKKSSNNNIPILNKLIGSSENIKFDIKENQEMNVKEMVPVNENDIEPNEKINEKKINTDVETKEIIKENNYQTESDDQIIKEDPSYLNIKENAASSNEIVFRTKLEKILNTNLESKHQFRICIVGDSNVGKTALLTRYCDDTFRSSMTNTIGVDFRAIMLKYNDMNIKLQIWDTAGQERFKSISVNYFRSANGFLFVYDIANRSTFENLNNWFEIVHQHNRNSICNFVVGNKCDLEENRQVSIEEGKELAFNKKFNFMETSAKSAKNVDIAFEIFTMKLIEHYNLMKNKFDDNSSSCSIDDGKRFKIDDVYDETTMSKKKKKIGCQC